MEQRLLAEADKYLQQYLGRITNCVERLEEAQLWWRPNPACNSIGNLLLHLRGNLSQWVLGGIAGQPITRYRSAEFAADAGTKAELLAGLREVVTRVREAIATMTAAGLARRTTVQGYDVDGVGIVIHVVEHMSYHTGQIVAATKQLLGPAAEIEFYPQHRGE